PPLLHFLLYPFGGARSRVALSVLSPAIDAATVAVIYLMSISIGIAEPLWPAMIYAVTPFNVIDAASLNPRPLSNLFLTSSLMAILLLVEQSHSIFISIVIWCCIVVFETMVLLSSKLAVQALLPLHLFSTVYAAIADILLMAVVGVALLAALALANTLTMGSYLRSVLPDHLRYVRMHMKYGHYSTGRKSIQSPIILLKSNPVAFTAPFLGLILLWTGSAFESAPLLAGWSFVILLMAQTWIWGDGWRYLQLESAAGATILTGGAFALLGNAEATIVLGVIVVGLAFLTALQLRRSIKNDQAGRIIEALESIPAEWRARLAGSQLFTNAQSYSVAYATRGRILMGTPSSAGVELNLALQRLSGKPLTEIDKYAETELGVRLDYFLLFRWLSSPPSDGYEPAYESELVQIYANETP
ncbi:MAG: hypothetical protein FJY85_12530, partial [Deltaproteobacteria bacterium]|nr:hypothetical protein [Deltaproteobacteria bacterium]